MIHPPPPAESVSKKRKSKTPEISFGGSPLKLHHPFSLFENLEVHRSTPLSLHPDTLLRVVSGRGLLEAIRKANPKLIALFRKLSYVDKQKHKASEGLRAHAIAEFKPLGTILTQTEIERSFDDPDYEIPGAAEPWKSILQSLQTVNDDWTSGLLGKALRWMAACDEHARHVQTLLKNGDQATADMYLRELLSPSLRSWNDLNPSLDLPAIIPLEIPLMALVRLDVEGRGEPISSGIEKSFLIHYLNPEARPISHWFQEVCELSNCQNLGKLHKALLNVGATYKGDAVSHDRLKKWARSKEVLMPIAAIDSVLMALTKKENAIVMKDRYYAVRFLTFACDFTRSATKLEIPPAWESIQSQIRNRYEQAYCLQARFVAA